MGSENTCQYLFHEFGAREANHRVRGHTHEKAWHFDLQLRGQATFEHAHGTIELSEWESILVPPEVWHAFTYGKEPVSYISVKFIYRESSAPAHPVALTRESIGTPIVNALSIYLQNSRIPTPLEKRIISRLLSTLVEIGREHTVGNTRAESSPFESACGFVESRINRAVTVRDVALHTGFSTRYVNMLFNKHAHCSAKQYINRKRAEYSREFVLHSALSIKEIANKLHFSSINAFSRAFSRHFGASPREFRKSIAGKRS